MAGMCNHTICRGNKSIGNNGCGLCLFGDDTPAHKFTAWHWVLENNVIKDNRWGLYLEWADWIDMAGNVIENNRDGNIVKGGANTNIVVHQDIPQIVQPPRINLVAPTSAKPGDAVPVKLGQEVVLDASGSTDPGSNPLTFRWDFSDGTIATDPRVSHAFHKMGPHSIGVTVTNGCFSDLAYRDFIVYEDVPVEFGTEGQAAGWAWNEVQNREGLHMQRGRETVIGPAIPIPNPLTKMVISDDKEIRLVGHSSLSLRMAPTSNNNLSLLYPSTKNAGIPLAGKTSLTFWVKMVNTNIHAWKGFIPTVTLYESPTKFCEIRPYDDAKNYQGGIDWNYKVIPLHSNDVWTVKGEVPATLNWMTIEFYPWGGTPFRAGWTAWPLSNDRASNKE